VAVAVLLLGPALALAPLPLQGQLPIPLTVEARGGFAAPTGEFATEGGGRRFDPGPRAEVGARLRLGAAIGVYGAVQQTWFGCPQCERLGLDGSAVRRGGEAGLHLVPPLLLGSWEPWVRAGATAQTLGFSGFGETRTSSTGFGFSASAGISIPVAERVALLPGAGFQRTPVEFRFDAFPDRSVVMSAVSLDLGVSFRF
jgi:hypothetical protein